MSTGLISNKTVLLISPQPWDHIAISKHNYAAELVARGNRVFFLEPPVRGMGRRVSVEPVNDLPGLFTVKCDFQIPAWMRFHARPLYDLWMRREIQRIKRAIGMPIDVVWSFEFNLYMNLRAFGGSLAIYHIVDPISSPWHVAVGRSADAIFAVSHSILAMFKDEATPSFLLGHGLPKAFADEPLSGKSSHRSDAAIAVGYSGNLIHRAVNRAVLQQCVAENPQVEFHFWGPADLESARQEPEYREIVAFVNYLEATPNVHLHGRVTQTELARSFARMDCLILSYQPVVRGFDRSNSHKMLEYLSTGNVVVSSRLQEYEQQGDLIRMPAADDDIELPEILRDTLDNIDKLNAPDIRARRREFALRHTYAKQIDRIEDCLASIQR